ncbi:hypothetical protein [Nocardia paucivorans]|uniref:hypothetical protein n=1 Tax=Nocardia paucivorans TaxID=114259 RepID=UPI0012F869BC|nr:hypothetical protein [Nocardia paucivorans]
MSDTQPDRVRLVIEATDKPTGRRGRPRRSRTDQFAPCPGQLSLFDPPTSKETR